MERDVIKFRDQAFQAALAVQVPEMPGVGEAGAQHAFVAGDDRGAAVGGFHVGGEGEIRGRRSVRLAQGEVALVHAHRNLHDLGWQVHVGGVDFSDEDHRPRPDSETLSRLKLEKLRLKEEMERLQHHKA